MCVRHHIDHSIEPQLVCSPLKQHTALLANAVSYSPRFLFMDFALLFCESAILLYYHSFLIRVRMFVGYVMLMVMFICNSKIVCICSSNILMRKRFANGQRQSNVSNLSIRKYTKYHVIKHRMLMHALYTMLMLSAIF